MSEPNIPAHNLADDDQGEKRSILAAVTENLKRCFDPEIPVDIYELGLIYRIDIHDDHRVEVKMTLTSPNCPAAQELPEEVRTLSAAAEGVTSAEVDVIWDPPWEPDKMSEAARLELGF
jgi:FeS assembly SUF system protein